jgi:hypothetical protein
LGIKKVAKLGKLLYSSTVAENLMLKKGQKRVLKNRPKPNKKKN